jgi:DNA-binding Xre family transcriptional regulator
MLGGRRIGLATIVVTVLQPLLSDIGGYFGTGGPAHAKRIVVMKNSVDLVGPLRERGITLSESQIYRIVGQEPQRIAFKVLVALCDSFGVEAGDLITYTATDTRQSRCKVVTSWSISLVPHAPCPMWHSPRTRLERAAVGPSVRRVVLAIRGFDGRGDGRLRWR